MKRGRRPVDQEIKREEKRHHREEWKAQKDQNRKGSNEQLRRLFEEAG